MSGKKVDESWKEKVIQEQSTAHPEDAPTSTEKNTQEPKKENDNFEMPPVDFNLFISSLGMQALMALGEIENPMDGKKDIQLPQGKYLVDTLEMLQVKTKGNLSPQEANMIESMLYEIRMKYLSLSKDK